MKRLLALLLACLLLTLTACGTQAEDIVTVEPSELTAEELPSMVRHCRQQRHGGARQPAALCGKGPRLHQ